VGSLRRALGLTGAEMMGGDGVHAIDDHARVLVATRSFAVDDLQVAAGAVAIRALGRPARYRADADA
jgi:uncharacterized protein YfdQ (DUF2303 family)